MNRFRRHRFCRGRLFVFKVFDACDRQVIHPANVLIGSVGTIRRQMWRERTRHYNLQYRLLGAAIAAALYSLTDSFDDFDV